MCFSTVCIGMAFSQSCNCDDLKWDNAVSRQLTMTTTSLDSLCHHVYVLYFASLTLFRRDFVLLSVSMFVSVAMRASVFVISFSFRQISVKIILLHFLF